MKALCSNGRRRSRHARSSSAIAPIPFPFPLSKRSSFESPRAGWDDDGYAEYAVVHQAFAYAIPERFSDVEAQFARHRGCEVHVALRSAAWTGDANDTPPAPFCGAIVCAPAGEAVGRDIRSL